MRSERLLVRLDVGTEHLLLGLLAEQEDGSATRALATIG